MTTAGNSHPEIKFRWCRTVACRAQEVWLVLTSVTGTRVRLAWQPHLGWYEAPPTTLPCGLHTGFILIKDKVRDTITGSLQSRERDYKVDPFHIVPHKFAVELFLESDQTSPFWSDVPELRLRYLSSDHLDRLITTTHQDSTTRQESGGLHGRKWVSSTSLSNAGNRGRTGEKYSSITRGFAGTYAKRNVQPGGLTRGRSHNQLPLSSTSCDNLRDQGEASASSPNLSRAFQVAVDLSRASSKFLAGLSSTSSGVCLGFEDGSEPPSPETKDSTHINSPYAAEGETSQDSEDAGAGARKKKSIYSSHDRSLHIEDLTGEETWRQRQEIASKRAEGSNASSTSFEDLLATVSAVRRATFKSELNLLRFDTLAQERLVKEILAPSDSDFEDEEAACEASDSDFAGHYGCVITFESRSSSMDDVGSPRALEDVLVSLTSNESHPEFNFEISHPEPSSSETEHDSESILETASSSEGRQQSQPKPARVTPVSCSEPSSLENILLSVPPGLNKSQISASLMSAEAYTAGFNLPSSTTLPHGEDHLKGDQYNESGETTTDGGPENEVEPQGAGLATPSVVTNYPCSTPDIEDENFQYESLKHDDEHFPIDIRNIDSEDSLEGAVLKIHVGHALESEDPSSQPDSAADESGRSGSYDVETAQPTFSSVDGEVPTDSLTLVPPQSQKATVREAKKFEYTHSNKSLLKEEKKSETETERRKKVDSEGNDVPQTSQLVKQEIQDDLLGIREDISDVFKSSLAQNGHLGPSPAELGSNGGRVSTGGVEGRQFTSGESKTHSSGIETTAYSSGNEGTALIGSDEGRTSQSDNKSRTYNEGKTYQSGNTRRTFKDDDEGRIFTDSDVGRTYQSGDKSIAFKDSNEGRTFIGSNKGRIYQRSDEGRTYPSGAEGRLHPSGERDDGKTCPSSNEDGSCGNGDDGRTYPSGDEGKTCTDGDRARTFTDGDEGRSDPCGNESRSDPCGNESRTVTGSVVGRTSSVAYGDTAFTGGNEGRTFTGDDEERTFTSGDKGRIFTDGYRCRTYASSDGRRTFTVGYEGKPFTGRHGDRTYPEGNEGRQFTDSDGQRIFTGGDGGRTFTDGDRGRTFTDEDTVRTFTGGDGSRTFTDDNEGRIFTVEEKGKTFIDSDGGDKGKILTSVDTGKSLREGDDGGNEISRNPVGRQQSVAARAKHNRPHDRDSENRQLRLRPVRFQNAGTQTSQKKLTSQATSTQSYHLGEIEGISTTPASKYSRSPLGSRTNAQAEALYSPLPDRLSGPWSQRLSRGVPTAPQPPHSSDLAALQKNLYNLVQGHEPSQLYQNTLLLRALQSEVLQRRGQRAAHSYQAHSSPAEDAVGDQHTHYHYSHYHQNPVHHRHHKQSPTHHNHSSPVHYKYPVLDSSIVHSSSSLASLTQPYLASFEAVPSGVRSSRVNYGSSTSDLGRLHRRNTSFQPVGGGGGGGVRGTSSLPDLYNTAAFTHPGHSRPTPNANAPTASTHTRLTHAHSALDLMVGSGNGARLRGKYWGNESDSGGSTDSLIDEAEHVTTTPLDPHVYSVHPPTHGWDVQQRKRHKQRRRTRSHHGGFSAWRSETDSASLGASSGRPYLPYRSDQLSPGQQVKVIAPGGGVAVARVLTNQKSSWLLADKSLLDSSTSSTATITVILLSEPNRLQGSVVTIPLEKVLLAWPRT